MIKENVDGPDRKSVVEVWLEDNSKGRHVQFAMNDRHHGKTRRSDQIERKVSANKSNINLLPPIHETTQRSNLFSPVEPRKNADSIFGSSTLMQNRRGLIIDTMLFRSSNEETLSVSSTTSSTITPRNHSPTQMERRHTTSLASYNSLPSINQSSNGTVRFFSLDWNPSLSETEQNKLDNIRQVLPHEFESMIPTLIKLGIILIPKKFLGASGQELSGEDLNEYHRLNKLIRKEDDRGIRQRKSHRRYGSVLLKDSATHTYKSFRESISFCAQMAYLLAYKDEIEREFNRRVRYWRSILIESSSSNASECSARMRRHKHPSNKRTDQQTSNKISASSNSGSDLTESNKINYLSSLHTPDHMDKEWLRKLVVNVLELAMDLLDKLNLLPVIDSPVTGSKQTATLQTAHENEKWYLVKTFKRWTLLISILYPEYCSAN